MGWLGLAVLVGAMGWLAQFPVPPPVIAFLLAATVLGLLKMSPGAAETLRAGGVGRLIAFHKIRIVVGAYFLLLFNQGVLPREFAVPAGFGDIVVGVAAMSVLSRHVPIQDDAQRKAVLMWNTVGLLDIVLVLLNGVRLFLRDPALGAAFTELPLALLPLFVVPIVIATHLLLFSWVGVADSGRGS